ncbi:MAG: hypothetical protein KJP04_03665 [Arenicella sp.]|nr:hypothetical protein [Arenicella sp.]
MSIYFHNSLFFLLIYRRPKKRRFFCLQGCRYIAVAWMRKSDAPDPQQARGSDAPNPEQVRGSNMLSQVHRGRTEAKQRCAEPSYIIKASTPQQDSYSVPSREQRRVSDAPYNI